MPTKKRRVGFIPREDVLRLIDKLSIDYNLSNSKIISILVEEALSVRGMFNKKSGEASKFYIDEKDSLENLIEVKTESPNSQKLTNHINFKGENDPFKIASKQNNQNTFDLQTYKKFLLFLKFQEMIDEHNGK